MGVVFKYFYQPEDITENLYKGEPCFNISNSPPHHLSNTTTHNIEKGG